MPALSATLLQPHAAAGQLHPAGLPPAAGAARLPAGPALLMVAIGEEAAHGALLGPLVGPHSSSSSGLAVVERPPNKPWSHGRTKENMSGTPQRHQSTRDSYCSRRVLGLSAIPSFAQERILEHCALYARLINYWSSCCPLSSWHHWTSIRSTMPGINRYVEHNATRDI